MSEYAVYERTEQEDRAIMTAVAAKRYFLIIVISYFFVLLHPIPIIVQFKYFFQIFCIQWQKR